MLTLERQLNALVVWIICGVLLSAYCVDFFWHEVPCPLCILQRLGMVGAACGLLLNVRFGIKMSHYGLTILSSLVGGTVALRQITLHVCPGMPTFGFPVLGLSLYTWSFVVFACTVLSVAGMLFLYDPAKDNKAPPTKDKLGALTFALLLIIATANVVTTYSHCGFGPCQD
ncbi:MAG: disulfide bond formation protein B [Parachlamydiaceae bacterium]